MVRAVRGAEYLVVERGPSTDEIAIRKGQLGDIALSDSARLAAAEDDRVLPLLLALFERVDGEERIDFECDIPTIRPSVRRSHARVIACGRPRLGYGGDLRALPVVRALADEDPDSGVRFMVAKAAEKLEQAPCN